MRWTGLLPLKPPGERKTRLAGQLSADERDALSERMLAHVAGVLRRSPAVSRIVLLAQMPPAGWPDEWIVDEARGLNAELEAARAMLGRIPLIVLHADLPLVNCADIAALVAAAASGCAIAPDRHGGGTNGVALTADRPFRFDFGAKSLIAHRAQGPSTLVERGGLALDLDTPEDLAVAAARGFSCRLTACLHQT